MSDVSRLMRVTMSCVISRVVPPAPYVTDTNVGLQRLEVAQRLLELELGRGRLRREELERVARPRREDVDDLGHRTVRLPTRRRAEPVRLLVARPAPVGAEPHVGAVVHEVRGALAFSTCMPQVGIGRVTARRRHRRGACARSQNSAGEHDEEHDVQERRVVPLEVGRARPPRAGSVGTAPNSWKIPSTARPANDISAQNVANNRSVSAVP